MLLGKKWNIDKQPDYREDYDNINVVVNSNGLINAVSRLREGKKNLIQLASTRGFTSQDFIMLNNVIDMMNVGDVPKTSLDVRVVGGCTSEFLETLSSSERMLYMKAVTYSTRQITAIVEGMEMIESYMDPEWTNSQKAMYLFEVVRDLFPLDTNAEKGNIAKMEPNQANIEAFAFGRRFGATPLSYAMMYRELCDRQGIQCNVVEGIKFLRGGVQDHAWNMLHLGDKDYLVDLGEANCGVKFLDSRGCLVTKGEPNNDFFAYYGDILAEYRPYGEVVDYTSLGCMIGMHKHLLENTVKGKVSEAVTQISNKWIKSVENEESAQQY